jgi:predicted phosphoribosyltransferase
MRKEMGKEIRQTFAVRREACMFRNREDAALQLAQCLKGRVLCDPLVLAIPRGGVAIGAVLARELEAEFDVVLSCKLWAPGKTDRAIGALSEFGQVYLNSQANEVSEADLRRESNRQLARLVQQQELFRGDRRPASVVGRSVIVTDDGILTGATLCAALQGLRMRNPYELIVAVPVASPDGLREVRRWCDEDVWLVSPEVFQAIDELYEGFPPVEDKQVLALLQEVAAAS